MTPALASLIREILADGTPQKVVMQEFGISRRTVYEVKNHKRWV